MNTIAFLSNQPVLNSNLTIPFPTLSENLLSAYRSQERGWVMVPPLDLIDAKKPLTVGSGAIGYERNGKWKLHISIAPSDMERALPILIQVLHHTNAPRLGFKVQTKANLATSHQIGKEVALLFDKKVEEEALEQNSKAIENCLSSLWNAFYYANIKPEPGYVLTAETIKEIQNAKPGDQCCEKDNLKAGKFDRALPCPYNINYFYYRNESFIPVCDEEIEDLKGIPGIVAASDILDLVEDDPDYVHNPFREPDPFREIEIKTS